MLEERESKEPAMNPFQKNESKETLFSPVSTEEVLPRPPSPPKKPPPITSRGLQTWKTEEIPANKLSIAWQLPQYILVTAAEVMFSVTVLDFSYSQAPPSMKSVLQAAWLLTVAVGNIIVLVVAQFSGLWAEFILFSCLLLVVCLICSIMGYYYVPLTKGIREPTDKQVPQTQGNMINLETKNTRL